MSESRTTKHQNGDRQKRFISQRRISGSLEPLGYESRYESGRGNDTQPTSSSLVQINRYAERAKARERLKCLNIADLSRSPHSVMSHSLLLKNNGNTVDLAA